MFLPETTQETKDRIRNVIGSWRLEGLEPSPETIRDIELVELGKLTYDEAVGGKHKTKAPAGLLGLLLQFKAAKRSKANSLIVQAYYSFFNNDLALIAMIAKV